MIQSVATFGASQPQENRGGGSQPVLWNMLQSRMEKYRRDYIVAAAVSIAQKVKRNALPQRLKEMCKSGPPLQKNTTIEQNQNGCQNQAVNCLQAFFYQA